MQQPKRRCRSPRLRITPATVVLVSTLWLAACTAGGEHAPDALSPAAVITAASDTAMFMAVVRERNGLPRMPVKVDPRPLKPDPDFWDVNADALVKGEGAIVRARRAALEHAGYALTDALRDRECGPLAIPPDINTNPACPRDDYYSLILSLARPPEPELSRPCEGRQAVVRLVNRSMGPNGALRSVSDFILCDAGGRWRVIDEVNLYNE